MYRVRYSLEHTFSVFFFLGSGDRDNRPTCSNLRIVRPCLTVFFIPKSLCPDLIRCHLGTNFERLFLNTCICVTEYTAGWLAFTKRHVTSGCALCTISYYAELWPVRNFCERQLYTMCWWIERSVVLLKETLTLVRIDRVNGWWNNFKNSVCSSW